MSVESGALILSLRSRLQCPTSMQGLASQRYHGMLTLPPGLDPPSDQFLFPKLSPPPGLTDTVAATYCLSNPCSSCAYASSEQDAAWMHSKHICEAGQEPNVCYEQCVGHHTDVRFDWQQLATHGLGQATALWYDQCYGWDMTWTQFCDHSSLTWPNVDNAIEPVIKEVAHNAKDLTFEQTSSPGLSESVPSLNQTTQGKRGAARGMPELPAKCYVAGFSNNAFPELSREQCRQLLAESSPLERLGLTTAFYDCREFTISEMKKIVKFRLMQVTYEARCATEPIDITEAVRSLIRAKDAIVENLVQSRLASERSLQ